MDESPEMSGMLSKRRGGLAKLMSSWQNRFFMISKQGVLCYFDHDSMNDGGGPSESRARGRIDLSSIQYDFVKMDVITEGSPTPYAMYICPVNEEKWKLCAPTKDHQDRWSAIFERYAKHEKSNVSPSHGHHVRQSIISYTSDGEESVRIPTAPVAKKRMSEVPELQRRSSATEISSPQAKIPSSNDLQSLAMKPVIQKEKRKGGLKLSKSTSIVEPETVEWAAAIVIMNFCFYMAYDSSLVKGTMYILFANLIVGHTLSLRASRLQKEKALNEAQAVALESKNTLVDKGPASSAALSDKISSEGSELVNSGPSYGAEGKPIAGQTLTQVTTEPHSSPDHTWCQVDYRMFKVRIGPDYKRNQKKAPSGAPLYEAFAVDVFCTNKRCDHATTRFVLPPELLAVNTGHPHMPPVFVVQIQIPSQPPPSMFTKVEDGPGWAILMYFKITEDTLSQLKNFANASPAVKLFAEYCEKAPSDPTWRARFKVINSCSNLEELGMPKMIVSYNAKPVLIRRTGTLFVGKGYIEKNIHVHKFDTLAKSSIHLISSKCNLMYMQIGFVIEGREDKELPEALFGCVGVNKPQEDQADFLFDDL